MTTRRKAALMLAMAVCVTTSGCGHAGGGLASLPLPHPGIALDGYTITATFENALNLPALASVKLGGADVGQLKKMVARNYTAVTTLVIKHGVELPQGTTAELRSATPLGDVFVSVRPPSPAVPGAPLLKDGDSIPVEKTSSAATVEGLLTSAAILVNGGAVRNLTNVINGVGKATGDQGQAFGELIDDTNRLLGKLSARTDQLTNSLSELSKLSDQIDSRNHVITELMTAAAPATETLAQHTTQVADLVVQAGATMELLTRFPSIGGTDTSGRSAIADINSISESFNQVVLDPQATLAPLNRLMPLVIKSTAGNALSVRASIDRLVLCRYGDIGYKMDLGCHGPKWSTFNQILGSLKYTMFRLQERMVGRGPGVPQVPVTSNPVEPGGPWEVIPPAPGPTSPGEFCSPQPVCHRGGYQTGPAPGPVPPPAPAAESAEPVR